MISTMFAMVCFHTYVEKSASADMVNVEKDAVAVRWRWELVIVKHEE